MQSNEHLARLRQWRQGLGREERWAVLVCADPDALASAMTLKRIMHGKVACVDIYRINEVTRPDNLAMIRYLRIPVRQWLPEKAEQYDHFAIVDSQPHHNAAFAELTFDVVIDHHPLPENPDCYASTALCDIRADTGATSTIMARYLQALRLRPGPLLATALLYGIRTDTGTFERCGTEEDLRAYQWLFQRADNQMLRRIIRSEYLREWLPLFTRAFQTLIDCGAGGAYVKLNKVGNGDLLVALADFFTKVHGLKWIAVSGIVDDTIVVVFRGDGSRDLGRFADACFHDVGSAGGHRSMARAEFPLSAVPEGFRPGEFVLKRLQNTRKLRPREKKGQTAAETPNTQGDA